MWFVFTMIVLLGWGLTDMFYKMGTVESDPHSFLKITVWVGLIMGIVSIILLPFSESGLPLGTLLFAYKGAISSSLLYILSMVVGYAGLRYLELSIISPVQNASGAVSMVGMIVFFIITGKYTEFRDIAGPLDVVGVLFIVAGLIALATVEKRVAQRDKIEAQKEDRDRKYRMGAMALIFPIAYCILDSLGTAVTGIILDDQVGEALGEIDNQIIYGVYFFAAAVLIWLFLKIKTGEWYNPFKRSEKIRLASGITETTANVFYIYAMGMKPVLAAPVIGSYCIVSMLLSRLVLKEKLDRSQYVCLFGIVAGVVIMGISEGLGA